MKNIEMPEEMNCHVSQIVKDRGHEALRYFFFDFENDAPGFLIEDGDEKYRKQKEEMQK
jgi:hypothetical protein